MRAPTEPHPLAPWASDIAQPIGALVVFVIAWEAVCRVFHVPAYLVPAPSAIFTDTAQLSGPVLMHTLATGETVLLADRVVVMSPRPGRIAEIVEVDLPRPRDFDMEARPAFQQATHHIRELIFGSRRDRAH